MSIKIVRLACVSIEIVQMLVIFNHLQLWFTVAKQNFKRDKFNLYNLAR